MRNKLLLFVLSAFFLGSCETSVKNAFTLHVEAENVDGKKLLLEKRADGQWIKLDSALITDGVATFSGEILIPEMYFLNLEDVRAAYGFFVEPAQINIKLDPQNIRESLTTGSATQDRYMAFMQEYDVYTNQLYHHSQAYRQADLSGDSQAKSEAEQAYEAVEAEQAAFLVNYIRENGSDVVAHYMLFRNSYLFDLEELEAMIVHFDPDVQTTYSQAMLDRVSILRKVTVGRPFVEFEQAGPDGEMIALSELVGVNYLLIDFWASWCAPCRQENPNIVAVYQDYKDKGFDVFGVSLDTSHEKWLEAIEADQLTWSHVSDLAGWANAAGKLYGVQSIPHSVLLDTNGTIIAKNLRDEALRLKIAELLD
jgi:peroxiredoxin